MRFDKISPFGHKADIENRLSLDGKEREICVLCGKVTDVLKTEPLANRLGYLPGAGQLCRECTIENVQEENAAMRSGFVYTLPLYEKEK